MREIRDGEQVRLSYDMVIAIKMIEEATAIVFDNDKNVRIGKFRGLGKLDIIAMPPADFSCQDNEGSFRSQYRYISFKYEALIGCGSCPLTATLFVYRPREFLNGNCLVPHSARISIKSGSQFVFEWKHGIIEQFIKP